MENKTKKSAVKATTKKVKAETKQTTEKVETKVEKKAKSVEKPKKLLIVNLTDIRERIHSLEDAYVNAINGKIKFADVKDIFKKLHKEIKTATKK